MSTSSEQYFSSISRDMRCIDQKRRAFLRDKSKAFLFVYKASLCARRIVGNTLGSVEGLGRNGMLKVSLYIMYTLLNNIADYVVDQTFKGK